MVAKAEEVLRQALAMSDADRAMLAERLIASLDPESDDDVEVAWQEEVSRRLAEIDSGAVKPIPWDTALESIREELRERHRNPSGREK